MVSVPQKIAQGAIRAQTYQKNWNEANLSTTLRRFVGNNPKISYTSSGKKIYHGNNGIRVVQDLNGNYFRIEDTKLSGSRKYLDLNGNVPNNKISPNGKQQGRTPSKYNEVTHFRIKE
ncbi:hypothetical protein [Paralysiella testudinis]|uniref:Uncharacterized protein n=1 Tax=Paralysiella testudinis TaxID=2809020 RepID=A0A892ZEK9_9NEIS|nr:hypothetical protein [Paralysiella testudinis]QRQ80938.1 hypothetical protein JQU52_09335 [Paralysiella testudinis]